MESIDWCFASANSGKSYLYNIKRPHLKLLLKLVSLEVILQKKFSYLGDFQLNFGSMSKTLGTSSQSFSVRGSLGYGNKPLPYKGYSGLPVFLTEAKMNVFDTTEYLTARVETYQANFILFE